MAIRYKVCVDCTDPHRLAAFWAEALGYVVEDNSTLINTLIEQGQVGDADVIEVDGRPAFKKAAAARDPDAPFDEFTGVGAGGRLLFQQVPEAKTVKNRVHLDLHAGAERDKLVARLTDLGATVLWTGEEGGQQWVTLADPEGNEFCVA
jgi:hypothetical protein